MKKIRKEVSHRHSDEAPVSFCEVAAYFSEEEWKLLHKWQKELYENVMKEIQQAVISLGDITGKADVLFRKTRKAKKSLNDTLETNLWESHNGPSAGYQILNSDDILRMEQELESSFVEGCGSSEREGHTCNSAGHGAKVAVASFSVKEEEENSMGHPSSEEGQDILSAPRPEVTPPGKSMGINAVGEPYPIGAHCFRKREGMDSPAGERSSKRKPKAEESVIFTERNLPPKASPEKATVEGIQNSERMRGSGSQLWPESSCEIAREKTSQCENRFANDRHLKLTEENSEMEETDNVSTSWSNLWNAHAFVGHENEQNWTSYTVPNFEKGQNITFNEHKRTEGGSYAKKGNFQCRECHKSFTQKRYLICHLRIHSEERPFQCTECDKSFCHKHHLIGHQRTHSGEKPFQCSKCTKSFTWKDSLRRHERTHMEDI
ncbi:zinc finger protein 398-like isoform X2 [Ambystoma mexicanum]|uniref:zinc finger protein 398-like isoform X2 n=1 Tax=Ambystoma mexicanum TaxID=8296 RepID=UPI0037E99238